MKKNDQKFKLGKTIQTLRKAAGMTQNVLAEEINCTPEYLSRIENGKKVPSRSLVMDIAEALDTTPKEMLDFFPSKQPSDTPKNPTLLKINKLLADLPEPKLKEVYKLIKASINLSGK